VDEQMSEREIVRTTCPRDCYDSCGIAVIRRGGEITKVLGDPDHAVSRGALCGKCALAYNGVWRDPQARLSRPLSRVGAKGEGRFEPLGWDQALELIAARLGAIVAESGPETILHAHYTGTCSVIANNFPLRFFNRLGATEVDPDTICNKAGQVALEYLYGSAVKGFDPRTARDARCLVVWGANPSASAPHAHKHWLKESPAATIVVDPVGHDSARAADLHLQPFPGSDAALAFALMHVLRREELIDRAFLARHTTGFDELEPLLEPCTPAWGEAATGVPAALIEEAARLYGQGPALLWLGQGLQRQPRGGNVMRACALLPALTGNIGRPGSGIYYLNGKGATRGLDTDDVAGAGLRQAPQSLVSHMDLAARLEDRAAARALVLWNINIAASNPEQERLRRALARDDLFTVVIDLFATDSTAYADLVLPAASFLEFDDLVASYFHLSLSAQAAAAAPLGEALPNQEIFRRLARAMGYAEPELYEDDGAIIARLLEGSGIGLDFDELKARGTVAVTPEPVILWAELEFPTPSGRIEIASAGAEAAGHPRLPLPEADPRPAGGRLRLLSPASKWLMNSSYGNDPRVLDKLGPARIALNPEDARARGLTEGVPARVRSESGAITLQVALTDSLPPGVALGDKSRWPGREPGGLNVNALNPGAKSDMGESTAVHGLEVEVTAAD
jgi:anaerobic selenocysteine-containing dehydrogenase